MKRSGDSTHPCWGWKTTVDGSDLTLPTPAQTSEQDVRTSPCHECKEDWTLLWSHPYVGFFLFLHSIFHLLVPPRGCFFAIIRHYDLFPTKEPSPSSRWSYRCFEQPPLHLSVRCAFRALSEQGGYAACKGISYILAHQGDHLSLRVCLDPVVFSRSKLQTTKWWSVDRSAPLLTWTSNTVRNEHLKLCSPRHLHG